MHRAFLQVAAILALLAVMVAAGGCVALYTISRTAERPGDAEGGVGIPLVPPGTMASAPATAIPAVTTPGGDGLPFIPIVTETPPFPVPRGEGISSGLARPSNATPRGSPMPTATPSFAGPPPHDEIQRPTLPATPL